MRVKAKIKATGKVVTVTNYGAKFHPRYWDKTGHGYEAEELELLPQKKAKLTTVKRGALPTALKIIPDNIVIVTYCGPGLLYLVLTTCNYEGSGDGVVLVDTDQLEATSDKSGLVAELSKEIQRQVADWHATLGAETRHSRYDGLVLLRG